MPEDKKDADSVSSPPEGGNPPQESALREKPAAPEGKAAEAKTAPATAAPVVAPAAKPATPAPAKPAAAGAAKPAAPAKPAGPVPEPWESELVGSLKQQYGSGIVEALSYLGQKYITVDSSLLREILLRMREAEAFDYCVDITAVHYPKREQPFDLVYVLYSFPDNQRIRVKTRLREGEHVPSAAPIWPTADWLEREVFDMFGIVFDGHPGLKRILLPDDWKGHPLRKDYDILQQDKDWVQLNLGIESGQ